MHMRQPGQLRAFLAASFYLCLLTTISAHAQVPRGRGEGYNFSAGQKLELGTPVEAQLGPNESRVYSVTLAENTYVQVVVEQCGIDVMVQVGSPNGKDLSEFDSPNGSDGPENVSFVAITAGTYRLVVSPLAGQDATTGKYEIKIVEM